MIEFLLKDKDRIIKKIQELKDINYNINEYWISKNFEENEATFAAGDGSLNKIDYLSFTFFGVGAVNYIHSEKIEEFKKCFIFDIAHPLEIEKKLKIFMLTLELKLAYYLLKNIDDVDYYLFDGSLYSLLISTKADLPNNLKERYLSYYKERKKIIEDEIKSGNFNINYEFWDVDYMIILKKILEEFKDRLIGISKTSKINVYFDVNVPDISIFTRFTKGEGYSKPLNLIDVIGNLKKERHERLSSIIKSINYLREFNINLENIYLQFVRVEKNGCILGLTSFKKTSPDILEGLKRISIDGYPYILKEAHKNVEINNKTINKFAKIVKIDDPVARYMLKR